ncbi:flagellar hook capping FlgD N-terminal domain-containing protein [Aliarcobacter cibarius]|uniref:Basal-body rod modification protein FlgD n=1 Tax=Aliarcobacter cibarius TaxID=255507 RepID=A0ABY2V9Q4_9BACT|nr:flagellar hook capping FlgD N-terminal domain-containing protein [Aliarcobacter cibarius]TLS98939.1 flagellar biosynthesis protein FlgD [Aliarcobacter cibarius]TLS99855.1 flagellar biosynthesis protein FlgD [Aliarcobacter cibarius]
MAEISGVSTNTGIDGSTYTSSVSNDSLSTNDFLKLMIQELKLQDPTKPMDSARMLETQMQMSTLNSNMSMVKTLESIQKAFTQSSISTATGVIGKHVENGTVAEDGVTNKAFIVRSIENIESDIKATVQRMLYLEQVVTIPDPSDSSKTKMVNYDASGYIYNDEGKKTGQKVALSDPGIPLVKEGKLVILDEDGNEVSTHDFKLSGQSMPVYSDATEQIPFSSITKIF